MWSFFLFGRFFDLRNINSLKNTPQFKKVYVEGKSVANRQLVLYVLRNDGTDVRLGISAGRKLGGSVERHRVMRLVRESFVALRDQIPEGCDLVVIPRIPAVFCSQQEIQSSMHHLFKLSGLMR